MNLLLPALLAACGGAPAPAPEAPAAPAPEAPAAPAPADEGPAAGAPTAGAPAAGAPAAASAVRLATDAGELVVTPVYHGTAIVQVAGQTLWLDPWSKAALADRPKADVVLITDIHQDHLDLAALEQVVGPETQLVAPAAAVEKLGRPVAHVLANGQSATIGAVTVTAVPMYNLVRGPEEGGVFHDKGRGNGYLLAVGGKTVYFAGDTECTDEMKALQGVDLAFLPMNLPYTMTPEEAATCVQAFRPARVVPYHYAGSDLQAFVAAVGDAAQVELAEFYPGGLPW